MTCLYNFSFQLTDSDILLYYSVRELQVFFVTYFSIFELKRLQMVNMYIFGIYILPHYISFYMST